MAFEMNSSCLPLRFLLRVFLCLLAAVCGSFSSTNVQTSNLKLQPERPNNEYYSLRGSTFVLNCTILIGNLQAFNLTWQHNGKQLLSNIQQIDSTTIQLELSNTSQNDNGIYWCGPKSSKTSQGVNMSLTIADPPSSPPNLTWSVVGALNLYREYRIFWSASIYTGGLPVNYSVKLCGNDSLEVINGTSCKWSSNPECQPELVLSTTKDFFCVLNNAEDFISPCGKFCNYTIFVVATNDVGSALSWRYLPFIPISSATPFPPLNFNVATTGNDKELRVSWTARRFWKHIVTEYTILYHAKNKMENEVKKTKTEFILLTQLEAFVEYYVYLMVRFVSKDGVRSAPSEVQGPRIVKTPAGDPDTPCKVLKDTSVTFPDNPALRNVTVEWKSADNSSWRGTPGQYIVSCNHHLHSLGTLQSCKYHVDATSNITVLPRLNSADRYSVYIKMCNKEKKCGSPSDRYIIKELKDNAHKTTPEKNGGELSRKQIAWITATVVAGCIAAVCVIYLIRKCRKELRDVFYVILPLRERVGIPAPMEGSYYYANPSPAHAYDELTPYENQA